MQRRLLLIVFLLSLLLPIWGARTTSARAAAMYTVTDIGVLSDGVGSTAHAINNVGQVVGDSIDARGNQRGFLWQNSALSEVGTTSPSGWVVAFSINDAGHVTGNHGVGTYGGGLLLRDGTMTEIGALPSNDKALSWANDINNRDQVVGWSEDSRNGASILRRPFLWQSGVISDLTTPPGYDNGEAWAVNDDGQAVGRVRMGFSGRNGHAILWRDGLAIDLGTLGGQASFAFDINNAGQAVGWADTSDGNSYAFLWQNGSMSSLGTIPGYAGSGALAVNNVGQIVGTVGSAGVTPHGFVWRAGEMVDLNTRIPANTGWEIVRPWGINDRGQIVGEGLLHGVTRAFLLTPDSPPPPTSPSLPAGTAPQCFSQTGKCMQSVFADYWATHGSLPINGYPISDTFTETLEDGKPYTVQYFERVRMEYHPGVPDPQYRVQLGQFGRKFHPADPPVDAKPGSTYFEQTGHNVPPDFLAYWVANGGLAQFGFPLSEVFTETLEDGRQYEVQYFERARFERHPENPEGYRVLLGQFGRRILGER